MTRPVEQVEADVAAARGAWQDATEAHRLALLKVGDLRARAMRNDTTVTASQLAAANDEAAFAELGIEAKKLAVMALEEELRTAKAEEFADNFGVAEKPLREGFDQSMTDLESALDRVVVAWRAHAVLINTTYRTAQNHHTATARIRYPQYQHPSIDKVELRAVPVFEPVTALVQKTLGSLQRPL
jgi:hypothetical protein